MQKKSASRCWGIILSLIVLCSVLFPNGNGFAIEECVQCQASEESDSIMMDSQGVHYRLMVDDDGYEVPDQMVAHIGNIYTEDIVIPDTFRGIDVVAVSGNRTEYHHENGWSGRHLLKSVTIGKNVWWIMDSAFSGCKNLSEVKFGNSRVNSISDRAFYECKSLTKLELPDTMSFISDEAFTGSGLKEITIPKEGYWISDSAFSNCKKLKKVTIKSAEVIGSDTFKNCTALRKVVLPKNLEFIYENAFVGCKKLKKVVFKSVSCDIDVDAFSGTPYEKKRRNKGKYYIINNTLLENYGKATGDLVIDGKKKFDGRKVYGVSGTAFMNQKNLDKITLKNLKEISGHAFSKGKAGLVKIENVKNIQSYAFTETVIDKLRLKNISRIYQTCGGMKAKDVYQENIGFDGGEFLSPRVEKFVTKDVKEEYDVHLAYCSKLKEAVITGNIHEVFYDVGKEAYRLEKLTIESTQEVQWFWTKYPAQTVWFNDCKNLKDIYLRTPAVSATIKGVMPDWVTLHVPAEQVEEYQKYVTCKVVAW